MNNQKVFIIDLEHIYCGLNRTLAAKKWGFDILIKLTYISPLSKIVKSQRNIVIKSNIIMKSIFLKKKKINWKH